MNCSEAARYLPGYLDGTIQVRHRVGLREHLFWCDDCREQLEQYRLVASYLANLEPVPPPRDLALRIRVEASQLNSSWLTGWLAR